MKSEDSDYPNDINYQEEEEFNLNFTKMVVLSEKGAFVQAWTIINMFSCLISSYIYSWMAAFGHKSGYQDLIPFIIIFEVIFSVHIVIKLITDYTPEGETMPVRNL